MNCFMVTMAGSEEPVTLLNSLPTLYVSEDIAEQVVERKNEEYASGSWHVRRVRVVETTEPEGKAIDVAAVVNELKTLSEEATVQIDEANALIAKIPLDATNNT